jgi:hypothetical protein
MAVATKPSAVLILGPKNNADMIVRVSEALKAKMPNVEVTTLMNTPAGRWYGTLRRALQQATRVIVVPRPDGSIGAGTVQDLETAAALVVGIHVVQASGRLVPLEDAGFQLAESPTQQVAARFVFPGGSTT